MSIHTEELREVSGFDKTIETSALGMIFENLQVYQYNYPERSTIRELASNALDAVKERNIAQAILSGKSKEEDFYLRRDEAVYKDSNFNPDYYDLRYLATDDRVLITYHEGNDLDRDYVEILDYGVGLGGQRLQGYFRLGYSSKRNTNFTLGKFGIGAKSALSTGVDCYYVETQHNGLRTKWNVYSQKVNSLVPRFNSETEQENILLPFEGGEIYAEDNREPDLTGAYPSNYTKIVIQVKKHKKQIYLDAVKQQLMYYENVTLIHTPPSGVSYQIPTKAKVLYEDNTLVVASNTIYTKPHIILNGVNYGLIDFTEIELEDKQGNVGIKVPAEEVQVNPSRESVIWNDKTKAAIQRAFDRAVESASNMVNERLKTTDFLKWYKTFTEAKGRMYNRESDTDALGVLSRIIDIEKMDFQFKPDPRLGTGDRLLWGIGFWCYNLERKRDKVGKVTTEKITLNRDYYHYFSDRALTEETRILYTDADDLRSATRTVRWLLEDSSIKNVFVFQRKPNETMTARAKRPLYCGPMFANDVLKDNKALGKYLSPGKEFEDLQNIQESVFKYIRKSALCQDLEKVEVPEDYKLRGNLVDGKLVDEIEVEVEPDRIKPLSPEQLRKRDGRVIVRTPLMNGLRICEPTLLDLDEWGDTLKAQFGTFYGETETQFQVIIAAAIMNSYNKWKYTTGRERYNKVTGESHGNLLYASDVTHLYYNVTPTGIVECPEKLQKKDILTKEESERLQLEWNKFRSEFDAQTLNYFSLDLDGDESYRAYHRPDLRLIVVSKEVKRKLPEHVRPISEFFLSFTPNHEITMSTILANWYLAKSIKEIWKECKKFDHQRFHNSRIRLLIGQIGVYVQQYCGSDILHMLKTTDTDWYGELETFMENVLKFQQFVSLHKAEPELVAAQAQHLFGDPRIKGAVAFDMVMFNKIAELREFYEQAGFFLSKIQWDQLDNKSEELIREFSQMKGWDPWVFEKPYPEPILEEAEPSSFEKAIMSAVNEDENDII